MGRALEVVAGFSTNPGAVFTTLVASTGQSFTVRGTDASKAAWLIDLWGFNATAGELRVTSPKLHDQVQGIRQKVTAASTLPLIGPQDTFAFAQRLYAQDNLTVQNTGGGAELDCAALLIGYDDLQGAAGRFVTIDTLKKNGLNIVTDEVTVTGVATGNFGGGVAVDSVLSRLIANTDYAILGGMTDTRGCAVRITGIDFANMGVGFPCEPSIRDRTAYWFADIATGLNAPYIPVFNSANKFATIIDVETNGAGGTFLINLLLVQLAPGTVGPALTGASAAGAAQPGA
jgi:hypothetical protein